MAAGDVDVRLTNVRAFAGNLFDGVDDYIEIPHDYRLLGVRLTNGFTISAWIKIKTFGEINETC